MSGSAESITNEVRRLVLTCRHLQSELEQSIPKKTHQEIVAKMQETIDGQSAEMRRLEVDLEKAVAISNMLSGLESLLTSQGNELSSQNRSIEAVAAKIAEGTVPREIYEQSLATTRSVEENARRAMEQRAVEFKSLEVKNQELLERISKMVPREDYAAVQSQLAASIPRSKYEEDIQKLREQTIAKEQYLRAEAKISELERTLEHSVPKGDFAELMKEVSSLTNGPFVAQGIDEQSSELTPGESREQVLTN
jgi:hypothetical protein